MPKAIDHQNDEAIRYALDRPGVAAYFLAADRQANRAHLNPGAILVTLSFGPKLRRHTRPAIGKRENVESAGEAPQGSQSTSRTTRRRVTIFHGSMQVANTRPSIKRNQAQAARAVVSQ